MNAAQAKTIKIADYLQSLGYSPTKFRGTIIGIVRHIGKTRQHRSKWIRIKILGMTLEQVKVGI